MNYNYSEYLSKFSQPSIDPLLNQQFIAVASQPSSEPLPPVTDVEYQIPVHVILHDGVEETIQQTPEIDPEGKPDLTATVPIVNDPPVESIASNNVRVADESLQSTSAEDLSTNSQYYYNRPETRLGDPTAEPRIDLSWSWNTGLDGSPASVGFNFGDNPHHHHHHHHCFNDGHCHYENHPGGYYPAGYYPPNYPGQYPPPGYYPPPSPYYPYHHPYPHRH